ncbi:peptide chain release factor aRF-1 [Candidatus Pacearchaeota archaeon]|nr:peptide chain release factor aRF-1 [Candidatus Pacearchaeota archaeon]
MSDEKVKLKKLLNELRGYRGRHTELITVYVPADYNLAAVAKQLEQERSTAENIKSKTTKKNVLDALERLVRHLKLYKQTPKNGIALFCGNVAEVEGQTDIKIWTIEPPEPLRTKLYRCDQEFVLNPLEEMVQIKEIYGLFAIERQEATIGLLEGKTIRVLQKLTSGIPGKTEKGGQSAARFSRIREGMAKEYYRRAAEAVKQQFFNMLNLRGIIVGGPGPTKEDFLKQGELTTALKEKIIAVKDIGYSDEYGLKLLVEASQDVLAQQEITLEKKILERFFTMLATKPHFVAYGKAQVQKALDAGAVAELILSSWLDEKESADFEFAALNINSSVKFVSEDTDEGIQFRNLGGIGAILRFAI